LEKLQLAESDPYGGEYAPVYTAHRVDVAAGGAGTIDEEVIDASWLSDDVNRFYLLFDATTGGSRTYVLHSAFQVPTPVGRPGSEYAGEVVAQYEDVNDMGGSYVRVPDNMFEVFGDTVRVPTVATMGASVAAMAAGVHFLGPYPAGTADTEVVRTRISVWIPPRYVPLVLGAHLSPKELWETVGQAIIDDGLEAACKPLLDYIRAALIEDDTIAETSGVGWNRPEGILPDAPLVPILKRRLLEELPGRDTARVTAETQSNLLSRQLQAFDRRTIAVSQGTTDAITAQQQPKTPAKAFSSLISSVYKTHGGDDDACLPNIYFDMAKATKGTTRPTLQAGANKRAEKPESLAAASPFITPEYDRKWRTQTRYAHDKRAFDLVCSLADFPLLTTDQRADREQLGALSDSLQGEQYTPTKETMAEIDTGCKIGLPTSVLALFYQLKADSLMKDVDLDPGSDPAKSYRTFIKELEGRTAALLALEVEMDYFIPRLAVAIIYRWHIWFQKCSRLPDPVEAGPQTLPEGPDFESVLDGIDSEEWEPPMIPGRFLTAPTIPATGAAAGTGTGTGTGGGQPPPAGPPAPSPSAPVSNTFNRPTLLCKRANGSPIKHETLLSNAGSAPPRRTDGKQMCMSFWCHGLCQVGCGRAADHVDDQPADMIAKREAWCTKARGE